jgi:hypothetical protein
MTTTIADDIDIICGALSASTPVIICTDFMNLAIKRTFRVDDFTKCIEMAVMAMGCVSGNKKSYLAMARHLKHAKLAAAFKLNGKINLTACMILGHCLVIGLPAPTSAGLQKLWALYKSKYPNMVNAKSASAYAAGLTAAGNAKKAEIMSKYALMNWEASETDAFKGVVAAVDRALAGARARLTPAALGNKVASIRGVRPGGGAVVEEEEEEVEVAEAEADADGEEEEKKVEGA